MRFAIVKAIAGHLTLPAGAMTSHVQNVLLAREPTSVLKSRTLRLLHYSYSPVSFRKTLIASGTIDSITWPSNG